MPIPAEISGLAISGLRMIAMEFISRRRSKPAAPPVAPKMFEQPRSEPDIREVAREAREHVWSSVGYMRTAANVTDERERTKALSSASRELAKAASLSGKPELATHPDASSLLERIGSLSTDDMTSARVMREVVDINDGLGRLTYGEVIAIDAVSVEMSEDSPSGDPPVDDVHANVHDD